MKRNLKHLIGKTIQVVGDNRRGKEVKFEVEVAKLNNDDSIICLVVQRGQQSVQGQSYKLDRWMYVSTFNDLHMSTTSNHRYTIYKSCAFYSNDQSIN